ncbi:MAG: hypothetical protein ACK4XK_08715 [Casimicrobiaceae bacterium]
MNAQDAARAAARRRAWHEVLDHLAQVPPDGYDLPLALIEATAVAYVHGARTALDRLSGRAVPGGLLGPAPHPAADLFAARLALETGQWRRAEQHARRAALSSEARFAAEALELWSKAANHTADWGDCLETARRRRHPMQTAAFQGLLALERLARGLAPPPVADFSADASQHHAEAEAARREYLDLLDQHLCRHAPHRAPHLPTELWPDRATLRQANVVAAYLRLPDLYPSVEARERRLTGLAERLQAMAELAEQDALPLASIAAVPFRLAYQLEVHLPIQRLWSRYVEAVLARNLPQAPLLPRSAPLRVAIVSAHVRECTVHNYFAAHYEAIREQLPDVELVVVALGARDACTEQVAASAVKMLWLENDHRAIPAASAFLREQSPQICLFPEVGMEPVVNALAAHRHAPVQLCLWGHPASTALTTLDAFVSIDAAEPAGAEAHYTEQLIRLPGLGTCPRDPAWPASHPAGQQSKPGDNPPKDRPVQLVCAQSVFKWQPEFIDALGQVLARLPNAQLTAFLAVESTSAQGVLDLLEHAWAGYRISAASRLRLHGRSDRPTFLRRLAECDVALDSFLFSGGQTTFDSLSVGLAPVTLPGGRMRGRQTAAALTLLGLSDAIACSKEDWVERVVARCTDPALRRHDRERIASRWPELLADREPVREFARWIEAIAKAVSIHGRQGSDAVTLARHLMAQGGNYNPNAHDTALRK